MRTGVFYKYEHLLDLLDLHLRLYRSHKFQNILEKNYPYALDSVFSYIYVYTYIYIYIIHIYIYIK